MTQAGSSDQAIASAIGALPEPRLLSREQLDHYLVDQFDPMAGPHTATFKVEPRSGAWHVTCRFGANVVLPSAGDVDWSINEGRPQVEALWKYSLGYLPLVLNASDDHRVVDHALDSFHEYLQTSDWNATSAWMTSLDHAIAMQIRTLCTLACYYQKSGNSLPPSAVEILRHHVTNILSHPSEMLRINNHGAMVAIALVHAAHIFSGLDSHTNAVGWAALETIVEDVFDDQGVAGENSPEYQYYWIKLLHPLALMSDRWPLERPSSGFDLPSVVESARRALTHFTDHRGRFLPIGDSHASSAPAPPARDSLLVSESQGFVCFSFDDSLITFNCGHSNYAHKHVDDTSLTVAYRGVPLLLDSGFFGHDWNDPAVIFTKSQSAHSGLFLEEFDDLHPGRLVTPGREILTGELTTHVSGTSFDGTVLVNDGRRLRRRITFHSPTHIQLDDFVTDPSEESRAVQRFILPHGARISLSDNEISATLEGATVRLRYDPTTTRSRVRIFSGTMAPHLRGWTSPRIGELAPCYCLEVPVKNNRDARLNILLESEDQSA